MKRTIPLLITALGGFTLIISAFIPATEGWGEDAATWFDMLAAIAFILGGANLFKIQLKKISDRQPGWGYAVVVLVAFLITLLVGLLKLGSPPAPNQEFYGEVFATVPLSSWPVATIGFTPLEGFADGGLPLSVRRQFRMSDGEISFRGWMEPHQFNDLISYSENLDWRCAVEQLYERSQPGAPLRGRVFHRPEHDAMAVQGVLSAEEEQALRGIQPDDLAWQSAVDQLAAVSRQTATVESDAIPADLSFPESIAPRASLQPGGLTWQGPMSLRQRDTLLHLTEDNRLRPDPAAQFPNLIGELEAAGPLSEEQRQAVTEMLEREPWQVDLLIAALNSAGEPQQVPRLWCEIQLEVAVGNPSPELTVPSGEPVELNDEQLALISAFAEDPDQSVRELAAALAEAGDWIPPQQTALENFFDSIPSSAAFRREVAENLLSLGPLTPEQRELLLAPAIAQALWEAVVDELFLRVHQVKYPWSGEYNARGNPFWWLYEYLFKPLTATMFALLAFYVASAAFRAFRAKNFEAILLLGTAFIILLGRTSWGVSLTAWFPDEIGFLRVDELTIHIMKIFNTAGNRAIMIGIALGIVSTSLKILLGVDRSYLGSGDE